MGVPCTIFIFVTFCKFEIIFPKKFMTGVVLERNRVIHLAEVLDRFYSVLSGQDEQHIIFVSSLLVLYFHFDV